MESLLIAWRLFLFATILAFPQLLGLLLYFRLSPTPRWLAAIAAGLAPAIIFVLLAPIFLFAGMHEPQAQRSGCGMPVFGAVLMLYAGTTIELLAGLTTQVALATRRRRLRIARQT